MNTTELQCPAWCVERHDDGDPIHRTARIAFDVDNHAGHLAARALLMPASSPEVVVHATWGTPERRFGHVLNGNLYVPVDDAARLADMIEVLAFATPEQHRALAAAIRQAAGQIAESRAALASCGHPANEDGECDCASWPERAPIV